MCSPSWGRPSAASIKKALCLYPAGCCIGSKRSPVGLNELLGEPVVEGLQQVRPQAGAGAARNGVAQHKALQAVAVARLPICARQAFSLCVSSLQVFWDSCPAPTPQLVVHAMNWRGAKCVHDAAASAVRPACSPFKAITHRQCCSQHLPGLLLHALSLRWGDAALRKAGRDKQSLAYHVQNLLLHALALVVSAGPVVARTPSMG